MSKVCRQQDQECLECLKFHSVHNVAIQGKGVILRLRGWIEKEAELDQLVLSVPTHERFHLSIGLGFVADGQAVHGT